MADNVSQHQAFPGALLQPVAANRCRSCSELAAFWGLVFDMRSNESAPAIVNNHVAMRGRRCQHLLQVHIKSEEKHAERMCVRAKYMAMDPSRNKYVRNLRNIRIIQEYLMRAAEKASVPRLNNSNVDLSVSAIHATILASLRRCVGPHDWIIALTLEFS